MIGKSRELVYENEPGWIDVFVGLVYLSPLPPMPPIHSNYTTQLQKSNSMFLYETTETYKMIETCNPSIASW